MCSSSVRYVPSHIASFTNTSYPPTVNFSTKDALLEILNRLTDICQEEVLVLVLLPLFDVCVQANTR